VSTQQLFSSSWEPAIWRTIPVMEFLQQMWGTMAKAAKFNKLVDMIEAGLENMDKWYHKTKDTNMYFICLGKSNQYFDIHIFQSLFTVLNPN
jgi:hypothetical protein